MKMVTEIKIEKLLYCFFTAIRLLPGRENHSLQPGGKLHVSAVP